MLTVNGVTYTNENKINDRSALNAVLAAVIGLTDFTTIGLLKEHVAKVDGVKTDEVTGMFITSQLRLPGVTAATFAGGTFYTKHAAIKVDLFNITESEFATSAPTSAPKAATISRDELADKLAAIRAKNEAKPAAPAKV